MKKLLCAAAVSAVLAGCGGMQASTGGAQATVAKSAAYYCAEENLVPDGERLTCNWQPTVDEACRFANSSVLQRGTLAGDPQRAGRCNTGQWLVKVTPR